VSELSDRLAALEAAVAAAHPALSPTASAGSFSLDGIRGLSAAPPSPSPALSLSPGSLSRLSPLHRRRDTMVSEGTQTMAGVDVPDTMDVVVQYSAATGRPYHALSPRASSPLTTGGGRSSSPTPAGRSTSQSPRQQQSQRSPQSRAPEQQQHNVYGATARGPPSPSPSPSLRLSVTTSLTEQSSGVSEGEVLLLHGTTRTPRDAALEQLYSTRSPRSSLSPRPLVVMPAASQRRRSPRSDGASTSTTSTAVRGRSRSPRYNAATDEDMTLVTVVRSVGTRLSCDRRPCASSLACVYSPRRLTAAFLHADQRPGGCAVAAGAAADGGGLEAAVVSEGGRRRPHATERCCWRSRRQ
jgi:hypothetical protein